MVIFELEESKLKSFNEGYEQALSDVKNKIDELYKKYVVPENPNVPKSLIQGINHPISAMRAELLEWMKK